jgi:hypothetical protein
MPSLDRAANNAPIMSHELSNGPLAAICIGSTIIFALIVALIILLFRTRVHHKRLLADLERRGLHFHSSMAINNSLADVPRHVLRRSTFLPFGTQSGWNTLHSREDLPAATILPSRPAQNSNAKIQKSRSNNHIAWPFQRHTSVQTEIPLNYIANTRLSAIVESPAIIQEFSQATQVGPSITVSSTVHEAQSLQQISPHEHHCTFPFVPSPEANTIDSLKPPPLIISKKKRKKRNRAQTIGPTIRPVMPSSESKEPSAGKDVYSHTRSFSLGSQNPGTVPHGPVPALPHFATVGKIPDRPKSWVEPNRSRSSLSSVESIGSSLLAASPRITRTTTAWLRYGSGPKHEYSNSLITGPRPLQRYRSLGATAHSSPEHTLQSLRGSIRSNPDQLSIELGEEISHPRDENKLLVASSCALHPVATIATAEAIQLNRISFASSLEKRNSVRILNTTPRRQSRFVIEPNGSPAQRRASVLCGSSGHHHGPIRHASQTSSRASSTRSSNGNPFQWEPSPMASGRPSVLKGSPNSRSRGHRRQNCVRIQLSPQVFGAPGKSPSSTMAGIQEESPETVSKETTAPTGLGLTTYRTLPRPPSTSTFAPDLKIQPTTLRASLTPSSPTLSLVQFDTDFTSQELGGPSFKSFSMADKDNKRQSNTSIFTIPSFPSPGKVVWTTNVMPTPTFSFSRPSNEFDGEKSPPAEFKRLAKPIAPGSPPTDIMIEMDDHPETSTANEQGLSPFSTLFVDDLDNSKEEKDQSCTVADSIPHPPFLPHSSTALPAYKKTPQPISLPYSPNFKSTSQEPSSVVPENKNLPQNDAVTTLETGTTDLERPPSPIPVRVLTQPQRLSTTLHGPRDPPAKSVSSFVRGLRRLNSDAKNNRYFRFGRQASPALNEGFFHYESCSSIGRANKSSGLRDSWASLSDIDHALKDDWGESNWMEEEEGVQAVSAKVFEEVAEEDLTREACWKNLRESRDPNISDHTGREEHETRINCMGGRRTILGYKKND